MVASKTPFESKTFKRTYLIGTVIILLGMWVASVVILKGTPYFAQMLPILGSGVFWFLVVVPGAFSGRDLSQSNPFQKNDVRWKHRKNCNKELYKE